MFNDMNPADIIGEYREVVLDLYGTGPRTVYVTDREVPFPDGRLIVSRTDRDGIITHGNPAFVEMSGYSLEQLIGAPQSILRHPDMPSAAFSGLWECIRHGETWKGVVKNLRRDGAHYWVFATVIPNIRHGRTMGYTSVRHKPSRMMIEHAEDIYSQLLTKEKGVLA